MQQLQNDRPQITTNYDLSTRSASGHDGSVSEMGGDGIESLNNVARVRVCRHGVALCGPFRHPIIARLIHNVNYVKVRVNAEL